MAESSAWIIFISAVFATYIWRFAGVMISHRIEANHPIFEWFTCLAYGIIASLVARTLILPSGVLAEVSLWQRLIPMAFAFFGFYLLGKRLWVGIVFGETTFISFFWLSGV
jgi:branched-subunit amino acid transport protein